VSNSVAKLLGGIPVDKGLLLLGKYFHEDYLKD
jgi:hypothetical protein